MPFRSELNRAEMSESKTPLSLFHKWVALSKPNEFDKPTKQEWVLVSVAVLLAPMVIAFASIWIFFQHEFLGLPLGKRVLFALAIPFLLVPAYCCVVFNDVVKPLHTRFRLRARVLRQADQAVRELVENEK